MSVRGVWSRLAHSFTLVIATLVQIINRVSAAESAGGDASPDAHKLAAVLAQ